VKNDFEDIMRDIKPIEICKFIKDNFLEVPLNQRPYKWDKEKWTDLWEDMCEVIEEREKQKPDKYDKYHFFGPVFMIDDSSYGSSNNTEKDTLYILDGQQRIATIGIVLTVIGDLAKTVSNKTSSGGRFIKLPGKIEETLFYTKHRVRHPRIVLGGDNRDYYQRIIEEEIRSNKIGLKLDTFRLAKDKDKNKNIYDCYYFFLKNILIYLYEKQKSELNILDISKNFKKNFICSEEFETLINTEESKEQLVRLYESIFEGFFVLKNICPTFDVMYEIFETLNQRGEKLWVSDLFKNLIFDCSKKFNIENVDKYWFKISDSIDDKIMDDFLRHFWLSNYGFVRNKKLFRTIKNKLKKSNSKKEFEDFIKHLIVEANIYSAIRDPNNDLWGKRKEIIQLIDEISFLGFKQGLPLLLSSYRYCFDNGYDDKILFTDLLKSYVRMCVFNYSIMGKNPNELEEKYSEWAIGLRVGRLDIKNIINEIKNKTPDKKIVAKNLTGLEPSGKIGRYVLVKLNDALAKTSLTNVWKNGPTLEHVIPQKLTEDWRNYLKKHCLEHEKYVTRLGNMAILSGEDNRKFSNKWLYEKKRERYVDMELPINNRTFDNFDKFNAETVDGREKIIKKLFIETSLW